LQAIHVFFHLEMLVITGGKERTEDEFRNLLNQSGFMITGIFPTPAGITLLEAQPI